MKIRTAFIIGLSLVLMSCATVTTCKKEEFYFDYTINQNGQNIVANNKLYTLKRAPFEMHLNLKQDAGVYINVSENSHVYDMAKEGADFANILSQNGIWMGGAEYPNNKTKSIDLKKDETSWQYWFVDEDSSRFDEVKKNKDTLDCKRTIENYYDVDAKDTKSLSGSEINNLYVVITYVTHDSEYKVFTNYKTEYFRISMN